MQTKTYHIPEDEPVAAAEPAVAYLFRDPVCTGQVVARHDAIDAARHFSTGSWGPNALFNGTQEEFLEHIHRIEEGNFITWEEHQNKFDTWRKNFLANLT